MKRAELEAAVAKAMVVTCTVPGCGRPIYHQGHGICHAHYRRLQTTGDIRPDQPLRIATWDGVPCAVDGCPEPVVARHLCSKHYRRDRRAAG